MAYDSQVSTDYGNAKTDLRDGIQALTDWGLIVDELAESNYFVVDPPTGSNHHVLVSFGTSVGSDDNAYHIEFTHGRDWDTEADDFDGYTFRTAGYDISSGGLDEADSVEYWFERTNDAGFVFACRRTVGDGNDAFGWAGYELFDDLFRPWGWFHNDHQDRGSPMGIVGAEGTSSTTGRFWHSWGTNRIGGRGQEDNDRKTGFGVLNPDADWSNYVYTLPVWTAAHPRHTNDDGDRVYTPFATTRLWLHDLSGDDVNSGDVVQDDAGNDLYEIVDHGRRVAIRMD